MLKIIKKKTNQLYKNVLMGLLMKIFKIDISDFSICFILKTQLLIKAQKWLLRKNKNNFTLLFMFIAFLSTNLLLKNMFPWHQ